MGTEKLVDLSSTVQIHFLEVNTPRNSRVWKYRELATPFIQVKV